MYVAGVCMYRRCGLGPIATNSVNPLQWYYSLQGPHIRFISTRSHELPRTVSGHRLYGFTV